MVDNVNPTTQFHPYQPERSIPVAERPKRGGLAGILGDSFKSVDLSKARTYARNNSGMVLGGLAALVIGAGLMRKRR
jgi:LPXTG-motif cell wall-anchored protein